MPTDWQQILFDPQNDLMGRLDRLAKKRFWDENLADEAFIWILDKLKADNWARLDSFAGKSKPSTFLYTVFLRSLEDFSRTKFGYPRPKTWLKNMGDFWVQIWKRLCLEREPPEQIKMSMGSGNKHLEREIKQIMVTIKAQEPDCGKQESLTTIGGTDDDLFASTAYSEGQDDSEAMWQHQACHSAEEALQGENLEQLLHVIGLLTGVNCQLPVAPSDMPEFDIKVAQLSDLLQLKPDEQLVLKMKFQQGMKNTAIAHALDMTNYQVKTCLQAVIKRLSLLFRELEIEIM